MNDDFPIAGMDFRTPGLIGEEYGETEAASDPERDLSTGTVHNEPVPEIIRHNGGIILTAELPGVTEENLILAVRGDELLIEGVSGDQLYVTRAPIPEEVDAVTMQHTLKNGVLEVTFRCRA